MTRRVNSAPAELGMSSPSEDDLLVTSLIHPSVPIVGPNLKLSIGHVRTGSWTNMSDCMKFISKHGRIVNSSPVRMKETLSRIASNAITEQFNDILDGFADLYELQFYLIPFKADVRTEQNDIRTFGGISSEIIQQKCYRFCAFIAYGTDTSLFTPLYVLQSTNQPQTCFATEDERIHASIGDLIDKWNEKVTPRFSSVAEQNNDSGNDRNDVEMLHSATVSDTRLEPVLIPSTVPPTDVSQTMRQEIIITSKNSMSNEGQLSSATDLVDKVSKNLAAMTQFLDQATLMHQAIESTSKETDDREPVTNEPTDERELLSQNIMVSPNTTEPANIGLANTYGPPRIIRQPKRYRRIRMLKDLAAKRCPLMQAGEGKSQRTYIESETPDFDEKTLFTGIRVVTENGHAHPYKTAAPEDASVDLLLMESNSNERSCLKCDPDTFDPILERVFMPISGKERRDHRKKIKVRIFNWKQWGLVSKEVIEREDLRLCRLEFCLYVRVGEGCYDPVSPPSYSSVIEDTDGDVVINAAEIEPKKLCEAGGEKITVPLNVQCPKKGFRIECNGNKLKSTDFTMERKKLLLTSPPKVEQIDEYHLIINRVEYVKDSSNQKEKCLLDNYIPYVVHGQCTLHCHRSIHNALAEQK